MTLQPSKMVRELHQQHVQAGYKKVHWEEVRRIIEKALVPEFAPRLVSYSDDTRVIQESIVKNVALDPIVVCDVSAMNPNVMFELGMRLAFDMPTVVIKDSSTTYSFDTGPIEHVPYPADLRFEDVVAFQESLLKKVRATHLASLNTRNTQVS